MTCVPEVVQQKATSITKFLSSLLMIKNQRCEKIEYHFKVVWTKILKDQCMTAKVYSEEKILRTLYRRTDFNVTTPAFPGLCIQNVRCIRISLVPRPRSRRDKPRGLGTRLYTNALLSVSIIFHHVLVCLFFRMAFSIIYRSGRVVRNGEGLWRLIMWCGRKVDVGRVHGSRLQIHVP